MPSRRSGELARDVVGSFCRMRITDVECGAFDECRLRFCFFAIGAHHTALVIARCSARVIRGEQVVVSLMLQRVYLEYVS